MQDRAVRLLEVQGAGEGLGRLHVLERPRRIAERGRDAVPPLTGAAGEEREGLHVGVQVDDELHGGTRRVDLGPVLIDAQVVGVAGEGCALPTVDDLHPRRGVEGVELEEVAHARRVQAHLADEATRRLARVAPFGGAVHRHDRLPGVGPLPGKQLVPGGAVAVERGVGHAHRVLVAGLGDDVGGAPPVVPPVDVLVLVPGEVDEAVGARASNAGRHRRRPGRGHGEGQQRQCDEDPARPSSPWRPTPPVARPWFGTPGSRRPSARRAPRRAGTDRRCSAGQGRCGRSR